MARTRSRKILDRAQPRDEPALIRVRGAKTHNLRNIEVAIPRLGLVVVTGVSGSGKTSLAFDTLAAEGQRRFLECIGADSGYLIDRLEPARVDDVQGLPPTVAIDQKTAAPSPRSTLGSITEINDFLRLLFARFSRPHCPGCGRAIERHAPEQIVSRLLALEPGRKVQILSPLVRNKPGAHPEAFAAIRQAGLLRARIDGTPGEIAEPPPALEASTPHSIEAVVDRLVIREGVRQRLAESVDLALGLAGGLMLALIDDQAGGWAEELFSVSFTCPDCGTELGQLEPRAFSFNSPQGACPACQGLGTQAGPAQPGAADLDPPPCAECQGARLGRAALGARVDGRSIAEIWSDEADALEAWFSQASLDPLAEPLVAEIRARLEACRMLGLGHLALGRASTTLSGGELQRARLAGQLGSSLTRACYILDEPTTGLHPSDTSRLLDRLRLLASRGNTVIIVEHDPDVIRAADWVVDLGPGAGPDGGNVVAVGTPAAIALDPASITGPYLARALTVAPEPSRRASLAPGWIEITNARRHNLRGVTARFPLAALSVVTGVSGSGKSTLVHRVLALAARRMFASRDRRPPAGIRGLETLERLVEVDQSPIGRGPRSTPASVVGAFGAIRRVFASTREARSRGLGQEAFSLNVKGGRCETCRGLGTLKLASRILPELEVVCHDCQGARYNPRALEPRWKGLSIADVLALRVDESLPVFAAVPRAARGLQSLAEAGLGYPTLGQSSLTLSGGEAQRVKLAAELATPSPGPSLYILDEPTTGLHPRDVARLLGTLNRIVDLGHTMIVIEHNLDIAAAADWIVDLGPGGGRHGGAIVAMGPPAEIVANPQSLTGKAMAESTHNAFLTL